MLESVRFETAIEEDAQALSHIAMESKAHWDYPTEWLELWRNELTITTEHIRRGYYLKASIDNTIIAFAGLSNVSSTSHEVELEHCFVVPKYLSKGIGAQLFKRAVAYCRSHTSYERIYIKSDPNAANFYLAMGCNQIGRIPTAIHGRYLPLLEYVLR